jgi:hypothetical protein
MRFASEISTGIGVSQVVKHEERHAARIEPRHASR